MSHKARWFWLGLIAVSLIGALIPNQPIRAATDIPFTFDYTLDTLHTEWHPIDYIGNGCIPSWTGSAWVTTNSCDDWNDRFVVLGWNIPNVWQNLRITEIDIYADRWSPGGSKVYYNGTSCDFSTCLLDVPITPGAGYAGYDLAAYHVYDHEVGIGEIVVKGLYDDLDPTTIPVAAGVDATCKYCLYEPTGDWVIDAPNLVNFLACQLSNIYYCHVIPILLGIWQTLFRVLLLVQASFFWIKSLIEQSISYVVSMVLSVAYYLNGSITNVGNTVVNGLVAQSRAYFMTGSGSNFWDALISFFNNIGGIFGSLLNAINSLGTTLTTSLRDVLLGAFGVILALLNAILVLLPYVFGLIGTLLNALMSVINLVISIITIVPRTIATFQAAMAATTTDPIAALSGLGSMSCSNDIVQYYCTAGYVLDNTILGTQIEIFGQQVNILLFLIQVICFFVGLDRLLWALRRFQALSGAGNNDD